MFYALEITRVYEFEELGEREAFVRNRPISRMNICPDCARKILSRRKENEFLKEFPVERTGRVYETVNN